MMQKPLVPRLQRQSCIDLTSIPDPSVEEDTCVYPMTLTGYTVPLPHQLVVLPSCSSNRASSLAMIEGWRFTSFVPSPVRFLGTLRLRGMVSGGWFSSSFLCKHQLASEELLVPGTFSLVVAVLFPPCSLRRFVSLLLCPAFLVRLLCPFIWDVCPLRSSYGFVQKSASCKVRSGSRPTTSTFIWKKGLFRLFRSPRISSSFAFRTEQLMLALVCVLNHLSAFSFRPSA